MNKKQIKFNTKILKAMSNENRFKVLLSLENGSKNVSQILNIVKIENTLMSHHFDVLKKAGLIISKREGRNFVYSRKPGSPSMSDLEGLLKSMIY